MSDDLKDLYDKRTALASLVNSPGWKVLLESAEAERIAILGVFCTPLRSMDEAPAQEFSKGRAYQLSQLAGAPQALIDNLTTDIESLKQETGNARDTDLADRLADDIGADSDDALADRVERAP